MSLIIKDGAYKNCPVLSTEIINYRVYCVVLHGNTLVLVKEPNVIASDEAVKKPSARKKAE